MKKLMIFTLAAMMTVSVQAAEKKDSVNPNKPVFTTIKELPITSVKNQNRSGTCWAYSTLSFFESEILKKTGKTYDLSEMFVASKDYMDRAWLTVRMHGDSQFSQGGSAGDVLVILREKGIVPESAMAAPGSMTGDSLANFNEFFSVMSPYVDAVSKSSAKKMSGQWAVGLQGILDAYLGKCPEEFTYEGKKYTPKSFAQSLGLNWDDYVSITSYTHHPFYTDFAVEVQDNWRWERSYNVPMDEMMRIIDNALANGYTIAWGGDVSSDGFTRDGLGIAVDDKATQSLAGSDQAKWTKMTAAKNERHRLAGREGSRDCTHAGTAPAGVRQLDTDRRPRHAHLRHRQGPERQGILHGEELLGRHRRIQRHLVYDQGFCGCQHHGLPGKQERNSQRHP